MGRFGRAAGVGAGLCNLFFFFGGLCAPCVAGNGSGSTRGALAPTIRLQKLGWGVCPPVFLLCGVAPIPAPEIFINFNAILPALTTKSRHLSSPFAQSARQNERPYHDPCGRRGVCRNGGLHYRRHGGAAMDRAALSGQCDRAQDLSALQAMRTEGGVGWLLGCLRVGVRGQAKKGGGRRP